MLNSANRFHWLACCLMALLLAATSCGTSKRSVRSGAPYVSRGGSAPSGRADGWATLDVKLGPGDNRRLYKEIKDWLGTPYKYAGTGKDGADCSGFVMMVYQAVYGKKLQRNSARMYERNCRSVGRDDLCEGDLVFFNNGRGGGINHVGIYLKDGKFAHTSSSRGVMISDLGDAYFAARFYAAGRVD